MISGAIATSSTAGTTAGTGMSVSGRTGNTGADLTTGAVPDARRVLLNSVARRGPRIPTTAAVLPALRVLLNSAARHGPRVPMTVAALPVHNLLLNSAARHGPRVPMTVAALPVRRLLLNSTVLLGPRVPTTDVAPLVRSLPPSSAVPHGLRGRPNSADLKNGMTVAVGMIVTNDATATDGPRTGIVRSGDNPPASVRRPHHSFHGEAVSKAKSRQPLAFFLSRERRAPARHLLLFPIRAEYSNCMWYNRLRSIDISLDARGPVHHSEPSAPLLSRLVGTALPASFLPIAYF